MALASDSRVAKRLRDVDNVVRVSVSHGEPECRSINLASLSRLTFLSANGEDVDTCLEPAASELEVVCSWSWHEVKDCFACAIVVLLVARFDCQFMTFQASTWRVRHPLEKPWIRSIFGWNLERHEHAALCKRRTERDGASKNGQDHPDSLED